MATKVAKSKKASSPKKRAFKSSGNQIYRKIISASPKKISITLPEILVGKTVELFAFEVHTKAAAVPARNKPFSKKDFWETFGSGKGTLISSEEIRKNAWRKHSW